jgi:predicted DNA-binding transcriptional regulator AlpA
MSVTRFQQDYAFEREEGPLSLIRAEFPPRLPAQEMKSRLPYPPPFQDLATLSEHMCTGQSTIENWVRLGLFPPPKKIGGKSLWSWKEVERHLSRAEEMTITPDGEILRIREATRKIVETTRTSLAHV